MADPATPGVTAVSVRVELPFEQEVNPFVGEVHDHKAFSRQLPQVRRLHRTPLVVEMSAEVVDLARAYMLPQGSRRPIPRTSRSQCIDSARETVATPRASRKLRQQTMRAAAL